MRISDWSSDVCSSDLGARGLILDDGLAHKRDMTKASSESAADLAGKLRAGDRRALARAITLIESTKPDHTGEAEALLEALLPFSGASVRIGISGVPGVGTSTFIERFGLLLVEAGHNVAVLASSPPSKVSAGNSPGATTHLDKLARPPHALPRPPPTGGTLGGVARRTREAMLACEAAGFDVVIVETVGVGQSETAVAEMVDIFLLLLLPGGGDELQGIKKGIVELADAVIVDRKSTRLTSSHYCAPRMPSF